MSNELNSERKGSNSKVTDFFTAIQYNVGKKKISPPSKSASNGAHVPAISEVNSCPKQFKKTDNFSISGIRKTMAEKEEGIHTPCAMVMNLDCATSSVSIAKDNLHSFKNMSAVPSETKSQGLSPSSSGKKNTPKKPDSKSISGYGKLPTWKFSVSRKARPTWAELMHEAILELGDRTGSSIPAITKCMKRKREYLQSMAPNKFKNNLNAGLKIALKDKRFVKIKSSYKINSEWVKNKTQALRQKELARRARETKRRKELEKANAEKKKAEQNRLETLKKEKAKKEEEQGKMIEALKKAKMEQDKNFFKHEEELRKQNEKRKALEEKKKLKELEIAKAKALAEKIRKRKFPMDDLSLRIEDKALGVTAPEGTDELPSLPYVLECCVPFDCENEKISYSVASVCSNLVMDGSRGLVSDVLQVFNFFSGDVGFGRIYPNLVPEFTFSHLMYSVNEVLVGNAKKARALPPLINYLFLISLKIIVGHEDIVDIIKLNYSDETNQNGEMLPLRDDLIKLSKYLTSLSWADVLFSYMDMMHRFYTTDGSIGTNVVPGLPLSLDLFRGNQTNLGNPVLSSIDETNDSDNPSALPLYYQGYFGNPQGTLACAYDNLSKLDPWNLSAAELMALLRALTDDILGACPELAQNISDRGNELYELLKSKKLADSMYRKVKLAYEGPKGRNKKSKTNDAVDNEKKNETKDDRSNDNKRENEGKDEEKKEIEVLKMKPDIRKSDDTVDIRTSKHKNMNTNGGGIKVKTEKTPFVPTASKKEFEAAEKARQKATENYEKGLKRLVSKSEPIGMDRNFNRVFHFRHNPEMILVEVVNTSLGKPVEFVDRPLTSFSQSWHIIRTKELFDEYVSSLDIRGIREDELYDALIGTSGSSSLKRFMFDDNRKKNAIIARKREEDEFERRLQNALIACAADEDNSGRRSRRLASTAQDELEKIKLEMKIAAEMYEVASKPEPINYNELTGLDLMIDFETENLNDSPEYLQCSRLWQQQDDTILFGLVGVLITEILKVEELCNDLALWSRKDVSRDKWIENLTNFGNLWNKGNVMRLGPQNKVSEEENDTPTCKDIGDNQIDTNSTYNTPKSTHMNRKRRKRNGYASNKKIEKGPLSLHQLLNALKRALIDLEARLYSISGIEIAESTTNKANGNSSIVSINDSKSSETKNEMIAWKREIHGLKKLRGRSVQAVRESIVSAITCARVTKQTKVLRGLREALHLCSPNTAVEARDLALKLLADHGDYEPPIGYDADESDAISVNEASIDEELNDISTKSYLCADALMVGGCLDGDETFDRIDWKDALKECKTLSRFSSLAMSFIIKANVFLKKNQEDRKRLSNALEHWKMMRPTRRKSKGKKKLDFDSATEIWAEVIPENRYILAKVQGYPWWPSITLKPKCPELTSKLEEVGRILISFLGETRLYSVKDPEEIQPYKENFEDNDLDSYNLGIQKSYKKSMVMMKRILRADRDTDN